MQYYTNRLNEFKETSIELDRCVKQSLIKLLNAYLSQPGLKAAWKELRTQGIVNVKQLGYEKNPLLLYRMDK